MSRKSVALTLFLALGCAEAGTGDGMSIGAGTGATNMPDNVNFGGNVIIGGFAGAPGTNLDGEGCNDLKVVFEKATPTVALLIDRSTSMSDEMYINDTRWNVVKNTILDPQNGLIQSAQSEVRFGVVTYTSTAQSATCPEMGDVQFKLGNYDDINAYYGPLQTPSIKGETPTAEGIRETTKLLEAFPEEGPKYIVLATDGEPDGCPGTCTGGSCGVHERPGFPRDPNCGHDQAVLAVQEAWAKGIGTFVIALGNFEQKGVDHLQALANAGQGMGAVLGEQRNWLQYTCNVPPERLQAAWVDSTDQNATVYRPESPEILANDLQTVIGIVRSCTFRLRGEVQPGSESSGLVLLDGQPLPYNDANGWRMNSINEVEVLGNACTRIQADSMNLLISFPCGIYNPE